jgi:hypothetical protein
VRATIVVFAVAAFASVIAHVLILTSVLRRVWRPVETSVPRPRPLAEIAWALLPLLVLVLVLTASWARVRETAARKAVPVLRIAR